MANYRTFGTILEARDSATGFFQIAQVQSIVVPPLIREPIDITHLSSPSLVVTGGHRERMAGIADSGPMSLTVFWDADDITHNDTAESAAANAAGLLNMWKLGTTHVFRITMAIPTLNTLGPFSAFVSNFAIGEQGVDVLGMATVELTIASEMTTLLSTV